MTTANQSKLIIKIQLSIMSYYNFIAISWKYKIRFPHKVNQVLVSQDLTLNSTSNSPRVSQLMLEFPSLESESETECMAATVDLN